MIKSPDYTKDVYRKLHETAETLANWKFQHKRIKVLDRFNSYIGLQNECYSISVDYSYCRKKSVTAGGEKHVEQAAADIPRNQLLAAKIGSAGARHSCSILVLQKSPNICQFMSRNYPSSK